MIRRVSLLLLLTIFLLPIVLLGLRSIATGWRWGMLLPTTFDLRGWSQIVQDARVLAAVVTTWQIGVTVVVSNLVLAIPARYALAYHHFSGKRMIETILFMPILVPSLAVAMGLHLSFIRIGLSDLWLGVVFVHLIPTVPYSIRILRSGYERVGQKWEAQSYSLGATKLDTLRYVMIPMLLPSLRATIYLTFVISLSQYALTAVIGGGNVVTLAMLYYPFFSSIDDAIIASFSFLFAAVPLLCIAFTELLLRMIKLVL